MSTSIIYKKVSYRELLKSNPFINYDDKYGLGDFITNNIKKCFIKSPNTILDKTAAIIAIENNTIVGRHVFYGTKVCIDGTIIDAFATGSTEVHVSQRGKGIGSNFNKITLEHKEYSMYLFSMVTSAYLSILSKEQNKCTIFQFPQLIKINNMYYAFKCRNFPGMFLNISTKLANGILWIYNTRNRYRLKQLLKVYKLNKLTKVPEWAGYMCINHSFKFSELHNTEWLQWNLDNNLSGNRRDIQSFYSIERDNKPVGFFMTKERVRTDVPNCSNMIRGTICEWASIDKYLTESDINILATSTFSKDCYHILTVTNDSVTLKKLKSLGFISYGFMQMGFQDRGILLKYPEMKDINQWRIRFACCNSMLY